MGRERGQPLFQPSRKYRQDSVFAHYALGMQDLSPDPRMPNPGQCGRGLAELPADKPQPLSGATSSRAVGYNGAGLLPIRFGEQSHDDFNG